MLRTSVLITEEKDRIQEKENVNIALKNTDTTGMKTHQHIRVKQKPKLPSPYIKGLSEEL